MPIFKKRVRTVLPTGTKESPKNKMAPQELEPQALKVLFLSSDTGGGHRASAESLAAQFELLFPGTTYDLLDVVTKDGLPPYNQLVQHYKHLSAHPQQWNLVFKFSNSRAFEFFFDVSNKLLCEKAMRKSIMEYNPDVVVSVHPMMTNVPISCCEKISKETGRHLPIFTVVTDLASAHCLWFANGVDKLYIASDECRKLAKERGKVPDEKIVQIGLPIRHQFALQADLLGDRMSPEGVAYQEKVRANLGLPVVDKKTILVMGGGEGVGSLANIVDALYVEFSTHGIDALILVVCGRNDKLRNDLKVRDWDTVIAKHQENKYARSSSLSSFSFQSCVSGVARPSSPTTVGCMEGSVTQQIKRILSSSSLGKISSTNAMSDMRGDYDNTKNTSDVAVRATSPILPPMIEVDDVDEEDDGKAPSDDGSEPSANLASLDIPDVHAKKGDVTVVGLGFVTKMAEYMVAADVLISKAGPGSIAEAASLSLPVMLTNFLPGQEEGNVDFVVEGKFGTFIADKDPDGVAQEVGRWLIDEEMARKMSTAAKKCGAPHAARDIVKSIGKLALKWKRLNDDREKLNAAAANLRLGLVSFDEDEAKDESNAVPSQVSS
jgi:UDP-N-acetylglucosamine:LPS N-acetylglucosamine transferase